MESGLRRTISSDDLVVSWENGTITTSLDTLKGSHQKDPDGREQQTRSERAADMDIEYDLFGKCSPINQTFIPPKGIPPIHVHRGEGIIGVLGCSRFSGKPHQIVCR